MSPIRARSSAPVPDRSQRPRDMTYPRSAIASAWRACCSTRRMPAPCWAAARSALSSRCTTMGASPSESSSTTRSLGWAASARAETEDLLLTAREHPCLARQQRAELGEEVERDVDPTRSEAQVLLRRQTHEDRPTLRDERDASPGPPVHRAAQGRAVEDDLPLRREGAGDGEDRRALARAVRAQQGDDLASGDLQIEVDHHREVPVADGHPPHVEQRGHGPASWASASVDVSGWPM